MKVLIILMSPNNSKLMFWGTNGCLNSDWKLDFLINPVSHEHGMGSFEVEFSLDLHKLINSKMTQVFIFLRI